MKANATGIPSDHCADSDEFVSDDSACGMDQVDFVVKLLRVSRLRGEDKSSVFPQVRVLGFDDDAAFSIPALRLIKNRCSFMFINSSFAQSSAVLWYRSGNSIVKRKRF